jgi:hypothetical protein
VQAIVNRPRNASQHAENDQNLGYIELHHPPAWTQLYVDLRPNDMARFGLGASPWEFRGFRVGAGPSADQVFAPDVEVFQVA